MQQSRWREGSTGPAQRFQEGQGQGNNARTAGDSSFFPLEFDNPSTSSGATHGPPPPHPNQARHSLIQPRKLPVLQVLILIRHIFRNAVKAHHSKQRDSQTLDFSSYLEELCEYFKLF